MVSYTILEMLTVQANFFFSKLVAPHTKLEDILLQFFKSSSYCELLPMSTHHCLRCLSTAPGSFLRTVCKPLAFRLPLSLRASHSPGLASRGMVSTPTTSSMPAVLRLHNTVFLFESEHPKTTKQNPYSLGAMGWIKWEKVGRRSSNLKRHNSSFPFLGRQIPKSVLFLRTGSC